MATGNANLDLLIKLLRMTTSSNDSEALLAMRKANEQLLKFDTDWEKLLRGRITVVADPFASGSIQEPPSQPKRTPPPPLRPQAPSPPPRPAAPQPTFTYQQAKPTTPPPQPAAAAASQPFSTNRINSYPGHCVSCGQFVPAKEGTLKRSSLGDWTVQCKPGKCVTGSASRRAQKGRKASADDLTAFLK